MGAGKSSLVLRFVKGQFFEYQESTIGAAFLTQTVATSDATVKFEIWDTAGQERYHSLAPMYYRGAAAAMRQALQDAGIGLDDIDYINAHGTSTEAGDLAESQAIKAVFGSHAEALAVSSTKSMIGHLLGAAGSVEAILTILALRDNIAPPTINLDNPSTGCDLNYVPHVAQEREIRHALSNSFGFGGTNGSLIFSRMI